MAKSCVWSHFPCFSSELLIFFFLCFTLFFSVIIVCKASTSMDSSLFQSLVQLINVECERTVILTSTHRETEREGGREREWKERWLKKKLFFLSWVCKTLCLNKLRISNGKWIRSKQMILIHYRWLQNTEEKRRYATNPNRWWNERNGTKEQQKMKF